MKRILLFILLCIVITPLSIYAVSDTYNYEADYLHNKSIILGNGKDLDLDGNITIEQYIALLARISGEETSVSNMNNQSTFKDVPMTRWSSKYFVWAKTNQYAIGKPDGTVGVSDKLQCKRALALLLRIMGINVSYDTSFAKAKAIGLLDRISTTEDQILNRGQICKILYSSLFISNDVGIRLSENSIIFQDKGSYGYYNRETISSADNTMTLVNNINDLKLIDGILYAATKGGVICIDMNTQQTIRTYNVNNSDIPSDYVYSITLGLDGTIWCSTDAGIFHIIKSDVYEVFTTECCPGLISNDVRDIEFSVENAMIVATDMGLCGRNVEGSWSHYSYTGDIFYLGGNIVEGYLAQSPTPRNKEQYGSDFAVSRLCIDSSTCMIPIYDTRSYRYTTSYWAPMSNMTAFGEKNFIIGGGRSYAYTKDYSLISEYLFDSPTKFLFVSDGFTVPSSMGGASGFYFSQSGKMHCITGLGIFIKDIDGNETQYYIGQNNGIAITDKMDNIYVATNNGILVVDKTGLITKRITIDYQLKNGVLDGYNRVINPKNVFYNISSNTNRIVLSGRTGDLVELDTSLNAHYFTKKLPEQNEIISSDISGDYFIETEVNSTISTDEGIWVGTEHSGILLLYRNGQHKYFRIDDSENSVSGITSGPNGEIYFVSSRGLFQLLNGDIIKVGMNSRLNLYSGFEKVFCDNYGNIWVTTSSSLISYNTTTEMVRLFDYDKAFNWMEIVNENIKSGSLNLSIDHDGIFRGRFYINDIAFEGSNSLLISTYFGLYRLDTNNGSALNIYKEPTNTLCIGQEGTTYIGTQNGFFTLIKGITTRYNTSNSILSSNTIYKIRSCADGTIFLVTNNSIMKLDETLFK